VEQQMSLFQELKRRNVIRVGIAYAIAAWFLLQVADLALRNIGAPGWVMQTVMLLLTIGFPLALIFAWAFERTPEGIKLEKNVDRSQSITQQTGRKLDRVIIGVLTVAVAYLLIDKVVLRDRLVGRVEATSAEVAEPGPAEETNPSVAVLPFVNMSGDAENEYFSDGLTETLLNMLAQLPDLRVAARTSSFAFKGQNKSIVEIAKALGVAHVLEGSVQKAGGRVRVTAQLIRADDGFHVWSQNYTRPLEDIFAIQDEIAGDVAGALGSSLLGGTGSLVAKVETENLGAYDSYLKGLEQQAIFSYTSLEEAENYFEQALASDPDFTDARLALLRNYLLKHSTGLLTNEEARTAVDPLIRQIREQDPKNRLARALELTFELQVFDVTRTSENVAGMVDELRNTLHLIPTETYIRSRLAGILNFYFDDHQAAIEVLQAGLMFDPLAADLHQRLGDIYADQHRFDEARAALERSLDLEPDDPNSYGQLSDLEMEADDLPTGLVWMRRATEVDPKDHELASLAPGSAIARSIEVQRAEARGETERALELARTAIADQIDTRQGAFADVVFAYARLMMARNQAREAYDFLASVRPETSDYAHLSDDIQGLLMQWACIALMSGFESFETRKAAWRSFSDQMNAMGFPWMQDPDSPNHTMNFLVNGETDKAIEHYLEHRLTRPLAKNLRRHERPMTQLYGPVYGDPRVAAALNEEGRRFAQWRDEVREMLRGPEWQ
jgi:TolB-like protein